MIQGCCLPKCTIHGVGFVLFCGEGIDAAVNCAGYMDPQTNLNPLCHCACTHTREDEAFKSVKWELGITCSLNNIFTCFSNFCSMFVLVLYYFFKFKNKWISRLIIVQSKINDHFMFIKIHSGHKMTVFAFKTKNSGLKDSAIYKRLFILKILLI